MADIFGKLRKMCLKIYHFDPLKVLSAPRLLWQASKRNELKLELLTDTDMLLMVEKGNRGS